jgi:transglutaminase-like putative cysteine protease
MGLRRRLVLAVLLAVLLMVAAGAAGRIFRGPLFDLLVGGAAVVAVLIGLLLARAPQWTVAPLSMVGMAGYTVVATLISAHASGVGGGLGPLLQDAVRNGGRRLLTALIPVEAEPDTVLIPVVLAWVAGLVAAELALRARRQPLALIPPILLYAAGLILIGPHGGIEAWRAVLFVALGATLLAADTTRAPAVRAMSTAVPARKRAPMHGRLRMRAVYGLGVFVVIAAAVVPTVALAIPDRPHDPRTAVTPPESDTLDTDPLARISGWLQNPSQVLFDLKESTSSRVTLAVLSDFDGINWQIGATYHEAGRALPAPSAAPGAGQPASLQQVSQEITIRDLRGRLVPAVTAPREIDGIRVAYDLASGTVLLPDGLRGGDSYDVVSEAPHYDLNGLTNADAPSGSSVARFLAVGQSVPPELQKLADSIGSGNAGAYQKASALEKFLAEHYTYTTDAPSGHAYPNLKFFLLSSKAAGGQKGTSEQFAASFAALGRLMGLPTQVVVGFTAKAGSGKVTGGDALAWPEVLFAGVGWVAFDPLPKAGTTARPVEQDYRPPPDPPTPSVSPTTAAPLLPSRSASASPSASAPPATHAGMPPWLPWTAGGTVLGLLVLGQAWVMVARQVRSGRRVTRGQPSDRVRGAWLEVLDALRLSGRTPPEHLNVTEIATWAGSGAELPRVETLAELANMVGFAPEWADDSDAGTATAQARDFIRALRRRQSWWRRLLWWFRPGPLRWRYGAPPPATVSDNSPLRRSTP